MFNAAFAPMMIGRLGTQELLIILVIVLLLFGPKYLPRLGKAFGKTMKGFKDGLDEAAADDQKKEQITKKEEEEEEI